MSFQNIENRFVHKLISIENDSEIVSLPSLERHLLGLDLLKNLFQSKKNSAMGITLFYHQRRANFDINILKSPEFDFSNQLQIMSKFFDNFDFSAEDPRHKLKTEIQEQFPINAQAMIEHFFEKENLPYQENPVDCFFYTCLILKLNSELSEDLQKKIISLITFQHNIVQTTINRLRLATQLRNEALSTRLSLAKTSIMDPAQTAIYRDLFWQKMHAILYILGGSTLTLMSTFGYLKNASMAFLLALHLPPLAFIIAAGIGITLIGIGLLEVKNTMTAPQMTLSSYLNSFGFLPSSGLPAHALPSINAPTSLNL